MIIIENNYLGKYLSIGFAKCLCYLSVFDIGIEYFTFYVIFVEPFQRFTKLYFSFLLYFSVYTFYLLNITIIGAC